MSFDSNAMASPVDTAQKPPRRIPIWAWATIIAFGCIDPLSHALIMCFPPEGFVATKFHTMDYYAYTTCMNHFHDRFSPYATILSPVGQTDPSFYSLPHHYLYGAIGCFARIIALPPFFAIAIANGLGIAALLLAAWCLLLVATPRLAPAAFTLFAFGGGIGGVAYLVCHITGLDQSASFASWFYRFSLYELQEGPRHQPYLLIERLYYALALALGLAALTVLLRSLRMQYLWHCTISVLLFFACTFLNFRVGPLLWSVAVLYLIAKPGITWQRRTGMTLAVSLSTGLATWLAVQMLQRNPELSESVSQISLGLLWLIPFLYALGFSCFVLPIGAAALTGLPRWLRILGCGATGYFLTFIALFFAYQTYYGNWIAGGDTNGVIAITDWALLGAPVGLLAGVLWRPRPNDEFEIGWFYLWGLAFIALSAAAFGKGWFIGFMPQRFIVVTGLPIAVISAHGLYLLRQRLPRTATALHAAILICGIVSILVTWTVSYGPWGIHTLQKDYPWTRYDYMTQADAALLAQLDRDVLLAPATGGPTFGDIAVLQGNTTVYGKGTLDFSRFVLSDHVQPVLTFFRSGTPEAARRDFIQRFGITAVLCPDIDPVAPAVLDELRALPWLESVASEGRGMLFRVQTAELAATTTPSTPGTKGP